MFGKEEEMKKGTKKLSVLFMVGMLAFTAVPVSVEVVSYAHSGRTDSSGGHRDNKNKSGLGSYHYHCGGHPAHLHDGGVCPYTGGGKTTSNSSATSYVPKTEKVQIKDAPTEMKVGANQGFTYSVENGTSSSVRVESSNTDVIVVNSDQTLKAVGAGEATITVSLEKASKTFTVVVKPVEVETIETDQESIRLEIIETGKITAHVTPSDATDKTLKWTSADEEIVTVDDGKLIPQKEGKTKIIIEASNGIKKEVPVEVYCIEVESIKIDDSEMEYLEENEVDIEGSIHLKAIVNPKDATYPDVTWASSDEEVVKVKDGEFEIVGEGKVVLTVTAENGVSEKIELEIVDTSVSAGSTIGGLAVAAAIGGVVWKKKRKRNK